MASKWLRASGGMLWVFRSLSGPLLARHRSRSTCARKSASVPSTIRSAGGTHRLEVALFYYWCLGGALRAASATASARGRALARLRWLH